MHLNYCLSLLWSLLHFPQITFMTVRCTSPRYPHLGEVSQSWTELEFTQSVMCFFSTTSRNVQERPMICTNSREGGSGIYPVRPLLQSETPRSFGRFCFILLSCIECLCNYAHVSWLSFLWNDSPPSPQNLGNFQKRPR